jgi:methyl-accepting chemotaxis protein
MEEQMNISKYKDWKISSRILSIFILVVFLFPFIIWFYLLPDIKENIYNEKRLATKHLVESVYALVLSYKGQADKGELSEEAAKAAALEKIKSLRYGNDDYFWINDMTPKMIMHPFKPEMNGTDISESKDADGKKFFQEMVEVCKSKNEGFVEYKWPKPGVEKPVKKISYVKLFKSWNWMIGSGIYVEDVEKQISEISIKIVMILLIAIIITIFAGMFFSRSLSKSINALIERFKQVFEIRLTSEDNKSNNEISILTLYMNHVIESQKKMAMNLLEHSKLVTDASINLLKISDESEKSSSGLAAQTTTAAASSEEISASINTVSTASEEMTSSIKEISKSTTEASRVTEESREKANAASEVMNRLGISSKEIGDIIKVITSIAEQTNLLALNATIEAARAGELGKGFAVVANEVKELAKESAKATENITSRIKAIQDDSMNAINAIQEIITISNQVSDITNTIAGAVEEQSVTVNEVNRNLLEASNGVSQVAETNQNISESSKNYAQIAGKIKHSSNEIKDLANELERQIKMNFKI